MIYRCVVAGAGGTIGRAVVRRLQADGWFVVGIDLRDPQGDEVIAADLADEATVQDVISRLRTLESVEAVVNAAGEQHVARLEDTGAGDWDRVMAHNARVALLTTALASALIGEAGGAVVHVASVHAQASSPRMAAYAASKGAVVSFARAAALELAPRRIRVNVVAPGAVDSPMLRAGLAARESSGEAESVARLIERTPLGRLASPADIAAAVTFLAHPELSAFITGQVLTVDGGVTARLSCE